MLPIRLGVWSLVVALMVLGLPVGEARSQTEGVDAAMLPVATGGETVLVSLSGTGVKANLGSSAVSISADGTRVAFVSQANNLHPDDPDTVEDVFVKDMISGEVTLVSRVGEIGDKGNDNSFLPRISADGAKVVFVSLATNLDPADAEHQDIYLKDLSSGELTLVSRQGIDGEKGNEGSFVADLSADGSRVAFASAASNLHPGDTDQIWDVFVKDIARGTITLASISASGVKGNGESRAPSLSADGSRVAFVSMATNLHPADTKTDGDVFVKDLGGNGTVTLASRATGGGPKSDGPSGQAVLSAGGTQVAFMSSGANLHPADGDHQEDVFVRNLSTGAVTLVSRVGSAGVKGNGASGFPSISADGTKVAFSSASTNLHPVDGDGIRDVFLKDLATGHVVLTTTSTSGVKANANATVHAMAPGGAWVAFVSGATNLHPSKSDAQIHDVFAKHTPLCHGRVATVVGTDEAETIAGTPASDVIWAGGGNDTVTGGAGNDVICGGDGNDIIDSGPGNDLVRGGAGADKLSGGDGGDTLLGEAGNDELRGGAGNDKLDGGAGADRLWGEAGNDTLGGGAGNDDLRGGAGNDKVDGGAGNDKLWGEAGNDTLGGGAGNDKLWGEAGNDTLGGGAGNDELRGGAGTDKLSGGDGNDKLWGDGGSDELRGGAGNDTLSGGDGNDKLWGDAGNDNLTGGAGDDQLRGGAGGDVLGGGAGNDKLWGDTGGDTLAGGAGNDTLRGGSGADKLNGGTGNDALYGDAGKDELRGGAGTDTLNGGAADDKLWGGGGTDTLNGGAGHDEIRGGAGKDTLKAGSGDDKLWGDAGNDKLNGGAGSDQLRGGAGNDTLNGGRGSDRLWGGAGKDTLNGGGGSDTCHGGAGTDTSTACEARTGIP